MSDDARADGSVRGDGLSSSGKDEGSPFMRKGNQEAGGKELSTSSPARLAPLLMMAFWMLLGGAAGIKLAQGLWHLLGWEVGDVSIAVPVGGVAGALAGALLGFISNPSLQVLLMAVFAGASAGAVAGNLVWGNIGEIAGQVAGGLLGAIAWAAWLVFGRR
jgi:hypothetical protein